MSILLLFPYHTAMIYNNFGENFYVKSKGIPLITGFIEVASPWFMPLLFVIAGISTSYAFERRNAKEYIQERISKLLLPLTAGILLLVPLQTFYAERFHNGYKGTYLAQYLQFFTRDTDLTGYTGGFTPAHLWFILYLLIISLLALPIINKYKKSSRKIAVEKLTVLKMLPMFLIFLFMTPIFDISGKSIGEFFALFMLGYFVLSEDTIQERLEKNRWYLFASFLLLMVINMLLRHVWYSSYGKPYDIFIRFLTWIGILSLIGMGKHYLNFRNKVTDYFSKASFPIYIFHQGYVVMMGYYTLKFTSSIAVQVIVIIVGSFIATMLTYEVFKRIFVTRFLFGIKE
jgi:surface polysaccharide O-acyltransferase-like enzyme